MNKYKIGSVKLEYSYRIYCIMRSNALMLTLLIAADITARGGFAQIRSIERALRTLQKQGKNDQLENKEQDLQTENESQYGSLKSNDVENLLQQAIESANNLENEKQKNSDLSEERDDDLTNVYNLVQRYKNMLLNKEDNDKTSYLDDKNKLERKRKQNERFNFQKFLSSDAGKLVESLIIQSLLSLAYRIPSPKTKPLLPSTLLDHSDFIDNTRLERSLDLNDHSKIYVILNLDAIHKSRNQEGLIDLLTSLIDSSSQKSNKYGGSRLKGHVLNNNLLARRTNRANSEVYSPKDSMEANHKQKRPRSHDNAGRTAIPYIRHRGDIYEREN